MPGNMADNTNQSARGGLLLIAMAWFLWSFDPVFVSIIGREMPRLLLASFSALFAALALGRYVFAFPARWGRLSRREKGILLLLGVFFTGCAELCYVTAIVYLHPAVVSAILRSQVGLAVLLAVIFLRERMTRLAIVGICMIVAANVILLLLCLEKEASFTTGAAWGWVMAFLAALLWSGATVMGKRLLTVIPPQELTGVRSAMGGVSLLIVALAMEGAAPLGQLSLGDWLLLATRGVIISALTFTIYYYGLRRVKVYLASAMEPLAPIFTMITAYLALGRPVPPREALGSALLLAGTAVIVVGEIWEGRTMRKQSTGPG
jgi:drug/metabolite transporter (DMT)-like permease